MIKKKSLKFFRIAEQVSHLSSYSRIKIGCIIVLKNRIISSGYNKRKTHPIQKEYNQYQEYEEIYRTDLVHAEIDALIPIKHMDLTHASIYIFRRDCTGKLAICYPCPACMQMIKDLKIKHLYYTGEDSFKHEQLH